jgi:hypothetical protein
VPQQALDRVAPVRGSLPEQRLRPAGRGGRRNASTNTVSATTLNTNSNEHYAGINRPSGGNPLILGILARETKNVRTLSPRAPVTLRSDPAHRRSGFT